VLQLQSSQLIACCDLLQNGWRYLHSMVARSVFNSSKQHGSLKRNRRSRKAFWR
jgi:hypothetical protein